MVLVIQSTGRKQLSGYKVCANELPIWVVNFTWKPWMEEELN